VKNLETRLNYCKNNDGNIRELRNVVERLIIRRIEISENDVKLFASK
jgi:transcriptional regulator with AAA-type ATPase domain